MTRRHGYFMYRVLMVGLLLSALGLPWLPGGPAQAQTAATAADQPDLALLYNSTKVKNFDNNLCKLAEYYGLLCKKIAVDREPLTLESLKDPSGAPFKLIAVNADNLRKGAALEPEQVDVLTLAMAHGANVLVSAAGVMGALPGLEALTNGTMTGMDSRKDRIKDYFISAARPELTREFTGQRITYDEPRAQRDLTVRLADRLGVTDIITSTDDAGQPYSILAEWERGGGTVFVETGEPADSLDEKNFSRVYYYKDNFARLTPALMVLRYVFGDEAWHSDGNYANLTIDDPSLTEPFFNLSYLELLKQMEAANFHTTIATIPQEARTAQPAVVDLFLNHPDRLSVVMHGNNHDDYEFYKFSVPAGELFEGAMKLPSRPLADQAADIRQGAERLDQFTALTGVPWERVMIFPYGIGPQPTMAALKAFNFLATVNAQEIPLEAVKPDAWDFGMYPATMDFESFPVIQRRFRFARGEVEIDPQMIPFDLFLDRPALFYTHQADLFPKKVYDSRWNAVVDATNSLPADVQWRGLGDIVRHLHRQKMNEDGSYSVEMYGRRLDLDNFSAEERVYHVSKAETGNVPITSVTTNGALQPYELAAGRLTLTVTLPARRGAQIAIDYSEGAPLAAAQ